MKKIFMIIAIVAITLNSAYAANDRILGTNEIPKEITQFVEKHFNKAKIVLAKEDRDILENDYEIALSDGTKIEFNDKFLWKSIERVNKAIPGFLIPDEIEKYVSANYAESLILKIERDRKHYEIELDNETELRFDQLFRLVEIDY